MERMRWHCGGGAGERTHDLLRIKCLCKFSIQKLCRHTLSAFGPCCRGCSVERRSSRSSLFLLLPKMILRKTNGRNSPSRNHLVAFIRRFPFSREIHLGSRFRRIRCFRRCGAIVIPNELNYVYFVGRIALWPQRD